MTPLYRDRRKAEFCILGATYSLLKFLRKVFTFNQLLTQHGSAQSAIKSDEVIPLTRASNPTAAIEFLMQLPGRRLLLLCHAFTPWQNQATGAALRVMSE